jgi:hypothetical protein
LGARLALQGGLLAVDHKPLAHLPDRIPMDS